MRTVVATWWFIMGCAGLVVVPQFTDGKVLTIGLVAPVLLILASILIFSLSVAERVAMLSASSASQSRRRTASAFLRSASRKRCGGGGRTRCCRRFSSFVLKLSQRLDLA